MKWSKRGKEHTEISLNGLRGPNKEIKNGVDCEVLIFEIPAGGYEIFAWQQVMSDIAFTEPSPQYLDEFKGCLSAPI